MSSEPKNTLILKIKENFELIKTLNNGIEPLEKEKVKRLSMLSLCELREVLETSETIIAFAKKDITMLVSKTEKEIIETVRSIRIRDVEKLLKFVKSLNEEYTSAE